MSVDTLKMQIIKKSWDDPSFKQSLLSDPKGAIRQAFGVEFPADVDLKAVAESSAKFYLVIPPKPEDLGGESSAPQIYWN
ncbi:NHLP leader peptide family RiPP precursor [Cohnella caldifontis]|uniref:NHLP leader peptide family RiPP precursor n=1 Tax=Cohnella caldifontis TaxID=3027471 RepID=UPI0023ECBF45|nr:NHLP leader peptide family RiPP precursor [Cohnella sp. YIM B05605]